MKAIVRKDFMVEPFQSHCIEVSLKFDATDEIKELIKKIEGVDEAWIPPFSRYSIKASIGKMFDREQVSYKIAAAISNQPNRAQ